MKMLFAISFGFPNDDADARARKPFRNPGRIADLLTSGKLFENIGQPDFDPRYDRFMLCSWPQLLVDLKAIFAAHGLREGNHEQPGD